MDRCTFPVAAEIELKHREAILLQRGRQRRPLVPRQGAIVAAQVVKHEDAGRFHALITGIESPLELDFIDGFEADLFRVILGDDWRDQERASGERKTASDEES